MVHIAENSKKLYNKALRVAPQAKNLGFGPAGGDPQLRIPPPIRGIRPIGGVFLAEIPVILEVLSKLQEKTEYIRIFRFK